MRIHLEGRVRRLGDNINTDYVIASSRKRDTLDESVLKRYLFETLDPGFAQSVRPDDLLVAGRNFGCGSAMEVAATVILAAGIKAVLAESFARTFYRNAVNNGLIPVLCDTRAMKEGDRLSVGVTEAAVVVTDAASGKAVSGTLRSGIMLEILERGGLVPYLRHNGRFPRR